MRCALSCITFDRLRRDVRDNSYLYDDTVGWWLVGWSLTGLTTQKGYYIWWYRQWLTTSVLAIDTVMSRLLLLFLPHAGNKWFRSQEC